MKEFKLVDTASIVIALATLLACFLLFYRDTNALLGSLAAAAMTAGLVWATYVILRWLFLANRG